MCVCVCAFWCEVLDVVACHALLCLLFVAYLLLRALCCVACIALLRVLSFACFALRVLLLVLLHSCWGHAGVISGILCVNTLQNFGLVVAAHLYAS